MESFNQIHSNIVKSTVEILQSVLAWDKKWHRTQILQGPHFNSVWTWKFYLLKFDIAGGTAPVLQNILSVQAIVLETMHN